MNYLEFLKDQAYKLTIPFTTLFKFDPYRYQNKKEFFTIMTIDGLLFLLILAIL